MKPVFLPLTLGVALLLTACGGSVSARPLAAPSTLSAPTPVSSGAGGHILGPTARPPELQALARVDQQGMVAVEVIPTNLQTATDTLDFSVAMNTHSVNLDMDLATLSTLTTDTGVAVAASTWGAPPGGGHHVSGTLIFPAMKDGRSILEGASTLTLTIRNVDAPLRTFVWQLSQ